MTAIMKLMSLEAHCQHSIKDPNHFLIIYLIHFSHVPQPTFECDSSSNDVTDSIGNLHSNGDNGVESCNSSHKVCDQSRIILISYLMHFSHVPQPLQLLNVIASVMMLPIPPENVWKVARALMKP
jgi:hypothetical protein